MDLVNQLPIITRTYAALVLITSLAIATELINIYDIYFNRHLIFKEFQLWRLFTSYFHIGPLGLDFIIHIYFMIRYSRSLEEGSFSGNSADYLWMLLFGVAIINTFAAFIQLEFLQSAMTSYMTYVWSRRNPNVQMSLFGLITFEAPYTPFVLLGLSFLFNASWLHDIIGFIAGHIYYFLEDVYPLQSGVRLLQTPQLLKQLFDSPLPDMQHRNLHQTEDEAMAGGGMGGGMQGMAGDAGEGGVGGANGDGLRQRNVDPHRQPNDEVPPINAWGM